MPLMQLGCCYFHCVAPNKGLYYSLPPAIYKYLQDFISHSVVMRLFYMTKCSGKGAGRRGAGAQGRRGAGAQNSKEGIWKTVNIPEEE